MGDEVTDAGLRPPGPPGLPLVGSTLELARDRLGFMERAAREYGDVVRVRFVRDVELYALFHPDHVRHVLVENNGNYVKGEFFQQQLELLGDGVLNAEGEQWRRQRRALEPAFHPDRIREYGETMVEYTERMLDRWADGEVRDVHEAMMELTLEIVADALFGVDVGEREDEVGDALGTVMDYARTQSTRPVRVPEWVPTPANVRYRRAADALERVVADIVEQRRGGEDAGDVVSMLVRASEESGEPMSDERLHDEVMTLLLAGHETTAQALTFALYLLAHHPGVERQLLAELDAVLGGRPPTVADLDDLVYTEQVVREAMRLYPPVPGMVREPVEDDVIGGYGVPAGATVTLSQWAIHRDPRFYDDPVAFDPSRWTDEFRESLHPFAYFPFGGGPRRCLGDRFAMLEARMVLATLLQRVHVAALPETDLTLAPSITLRPEGGLTMRVEER